MKKIFALFMCLLLIGCGNDAVDNEKENMEASNNKEPEKKLQIVDLESKTRPIAVMVNNIGVAQPLQSGLNDAYLVYEMITEGGITRLLAVFKDQDTSRIGSIRSSRHYYLDYALENDAVYVHYGWSEQAESDISKFGVNNINGMINSHPFWRDNTLNVSSEHTVFASIEKIKETMETKGYRNTTDKDLLLNYSVDEVDLSSKEGVIKADNVSIKYSNYQTTSYKYDETKKLYVRYSNGEVRKDYVTKEEFTAKNIITYKVENYSMDSYGRQELNNIGKGEGYFITNGYAIPITWEKSSETSQTVYKYLDGKEITVNDGNTYIQIQPSNQKLEIS